MTNYDYDLIAIGSGAAGRKVAVVLHRAGWKTAIVEKDVDKHFAGTCVNTGCIPTKALIEMVQMGGDFKKAIEHKDKIVERIRSGTLRHVEERVGVKVFRGEGSFIDEHTLKVDDQTITAEIIVVATGSEPMIPPIKGLKEVNYSTNTELLDLDNIPQKMLVIGAGRIGLEFAQLYRHLGVEVSVFEGMPQILPGEDEEMANIIQKHLEDKGISIYLDKFVDEVREENINGKPEFSIILKDGPNSGTYTGDYLLVATGRKPAVDALQLDQMPIPIELERNAIKVNEYMQTNHPNIFAIGDVVGGAMFTNWAGYQGGILLKNLKQSKTINSEWKPLTMPNYPRIAYTEPEFASTGLTEKQAIEKYGAEQVVTYKFMNKWLGKSMIVNDWNGVLKGVGLKGSNEIIGAHLFGVRTGSLIQMLVLAMENGLGWREIGDMIYGHPVLAEGLEALANNMASLCGVKD